MAIYSESENIAPGDSQRPVKDLNDRHGCQIEHSARFQASSRSAYKPFDDLVGSGEHDSSAQIFLVGKNPLDFVDRLFDVGEVPRGHFKLVELLDCRRVCGTGQSFGEIVEHSLPRAPSLRLQLGVI
jgi:hypothetical protein